MIRAALNSHSASVRMVRKALGPLTLGLAIAIAAHGTASAAEEFAGTWAADLANCKTPQSRQDAPLILSAKGYDQHETHCKFSGLKPAGAGEWTAAAQCSVEGLPPRHAEADHVVVLAEQVLESGSARDHDGGRVTCRHRRIGVDR